VNVQNVEGVNAFSERSERAYKTVTRRRLYTVAQLGQRARDLVSSFLKSVSSSPSVCALLAFRNKQTIWAHHLALCSF
jgi:hypothetical protein